MLIEVDAKTILGLLLFVPLYAVWLKLGPISPKTGTRDESSLPGSVTFPATASPLSEPTGTKKRKNKKKGGKGNDKQPVSSSSAKVFPTKKTDDDDEKRVPIPPSPDDAREPWISPPPANLSASTGTTTVTTSRNSQKKKSKGTELSKEEFPPLKTEKTKTDRKPDPSSETARGEPVPKSRGPDGGIRHPKDREIDEDETAPVRVIKLVSEPDYAPEIEDLEERRKDVEDGWVKVSTASGPRTLRITPGRSSTTTKSKPSSASANQIEETKKQRENRRKAERKREQKEAEREMQEERMRQHKRTMVGVRMTELAKEDAARRRKSSTSRVDGVTGLLWD